MSVERAIVTPVHSRSATWLPPSSAPEPKCLMTKNSRTPLVASTVGTGLFADMVTGDQYLSIILTCNLYKDLYKEKGFESRLLSRSTEDSATVTSVLIPWNSCGMTQATVLKVPTLEYLPYCFFNLISPLMSILVAATGYKIYRLASGSSGTPASSERSEPR